MSKTIKYTGTVDRWAELPVTGKQSLWHLGQSEQREDSEASQLLATGFFKDISSFTNSSGAGITATISPATAAVGDTVHATLPAGVVGTLQFTRSTIPVPPAAPVKTNIAGAVASVVNMLAYTIAPEDAGYAIGCDASNQISASAGVVVAAGPAAYNRYMATELRSNENYVTGNVVTNTPDTTYYKFEFDAAFDAAQAILLSKLYQGTPGTYKASLAVTDEPRIDTSEHAYLPQQGGVVYNIAGGKGWQPVTFGGAATKTIGLAVPADGSTNNNCAISLASDMLQLKSVARNDGKPGSFLLMKIVCINGGWTAETGGNDLWDAANGQPFYRVRSLNNLSGDAIADPTIVPTGGYYSGYGMMGGAQVHTTVAAELLMFTGDSRDAAAYADYSYASPNVMAWMPLSTPTRPLSCYNVAGSGHSELSFLQVALDRIANGGLRPTVIFVPGFSQNGFDTAAHYTARLDEFIASVRAVPGMASVKFVISTDYFVNGYAGQQSEIERQLCITHARALADNVSVFLFDSDAIMTDYSIPGTPKNVPAYMNGDGVHANDVGIAAMAYGDGAKPGLQSVYKTVLGIS
jgi:hypothetical protein